MCFLLKLNSSEIGNTLRLRSRIDENSLPIRREILKNLKLLGFVEDEKGNEDARFGNAGVIATSELLGAKALVIPTNEEWVIAHP